MRLKKELPRIYIVFIPLVFILLVSVCAIIYSTMSRQIDIENNEIENFVPIIPYTDFNWNCLSGEVRLKYEDKNYTSMFGIDVSTFQDTINWEKVKEDGVEFAFIRLGYRGAQEGLLHIDSEFENNYKRAVENGIKVGVYWYSQPANEQEAIEEAQFVLEALKNKHLDFPIVYDLEETMYNDGTFSRLHGFSRAQYTQMAKAFLEEIKNHQQNVMIYMGLNWSESCYNMDELTEYPIWLAQYSIRPTFNYPFVIWQYSDSGHIEGINTPVDFDILFIRKNNQN